jgi:hypothetical protein
MLFQVELSGYFAAEITWDFLRGRMDGDSRRILAWEDGAQGTHYDKEDATRNYVSVTSHEIAMYSILQVITLPLNTALCFSRTSSRTGTAS